MYHQIFTRDQITYSKSCIYS